MKGARTPWKYGVQTNKSLKCNPDKKRWGYWDVPFAFDSAFQDASIPSTEVPIKLCSQCQERKRLLKELHERNQ
jgi:hypothetical protein